MDYVKLGRTGLEVSRICLGCLSYGDASRGGFHRWVLNEEESRPFIKRAIELGINFFDTANIYSAGSSEEILGRALRDFGQRDALVVATKVRGQTREGPNGAGLSRKAILTEVDHSLRRLNMDYIDLYQIHRLDHGTPIEETLETLNDVVRSGKVRYIGASSMYAWQFAKCLFTADAHGWARFVSMQNLYNLLHREQEREMHPLCLDQGVGVVPWSPLAGGRLTRDTNDQTKRSQSDPFDVSLYKPSSSAKEVTETVAEIASERSVSRAQVALAWMLSKPVVTSPIVGATNLAHLDDAVAATELKLSEEEIKRLEDPYGPPGVTGFS